MKELLLICVGVPGFRSGLRQGCGHDGDWRVCIGDRPPLSICTRFDHSFGEPHPGRPGSRIGGGGLSQEVNRQIAAAGFCAVFMALARLIPGGRR